MERLIKTHYVKTIQPYYNDSKRGIKLFEVRKNDRDYQVGDFFVQEEFNTETQDLTGDNFKSKIIYLLRGGQFGIADDYCVLGIGDT